MSQAKKSNTIKLISLKAFLWFFIAGSMVACGAEYTPKPKGYNRIDLPDQVYKQLPDEYPYTFEMLKSFDAKYLLKQLAILNQQSFLALPL